MPKILIIGHPGAGKNFISDHLKEFLGLRLYDLDDVYYIRKFDKPRPKDRRIAMAKRIYSKRDWIACGVTFDYALLAAPCADVILVLKERFRVEAYRIMRRSLMRHLRGETKESFTETLTLVWKDFKHYHLPTGKHKERIDGVIKAHKKKTIILSSKHQVAHFVSFARKNHDVKKWVKGWRKSCREASS